jgi:penicillin-binding protein 1A
MRTLSRSLITVLVAVVIGGIAVGACLAALIPGTVEVATAHHYTAPQVKELRALAEPSQIYWADGSAMGGPIGLQARQKINSINEVPKMVQNAIIATEDRSFWTNDGIDLGAVFRAFLTNVTSGRIEQGGSTITQQLVKNRILTSKRDVNRKIREIEDALRLNEKFSKNKILVEYLNTVYFGSGSYGIKAAASRFFGKSLDQLSIAEAALLAGVISNPSSYDPFNPATFDRSVRRRADVLRGMVSEHYITQAEADAANNEPLPQNKPPANRIEGNDFLSAEVLRELLTDPKYAALGATEDERRDKILKGGLEIFTTFDPKLQQMAQNATDNAKPCGPDATTCAGNSGPDWASSLVSIDPNTGAVKAMISGQNFADSQTNFATSPDGRQTGSTFKVITLASALVNNYSPNDSVDGSSPCSVARYGPTNQAINDEEGGGIESLWAATAGSVNCAFVRLATSVGYDNVIATAHAMGIKKDNLIDILNLTLGTREQNTETMASVMATIASGGTYRAPYVVQKIIAADGRVLLDVNQQGEPAIPGDVAACEQNVLRGVVDGHGTGSNAEVGGQQIFGKTGTTDNRADAWFIGANPPGSGMQLATAVWFGNWRGQVPGAGFGGDSAAPVFRSFMSQALDGTGSNSLPDPGPVCARAGGFVNPDGGRTANAPVVDPQPRQQQQQPQQPQQPTVTPQTPTPTAPAPAAPAQTAPPATAPNPPGPRGNGSQGQDGR